jgi:hypothetical protein
MARRPHDGCTHTTPNLKPDRGSSRKNWRCLSHDAHAYMSKPFYFLSLIWRARVAIEYKLRFKDSKQTVTVHSAKSYRIEVVLGGNKIEVWMDVRRFFPLEKYSLDLDLWGRIILELEYCCDPSIQCGCRWWPCTAAGGYWSTSDRAHSAIESRESYACARSITRVTSHSTYWRPFLDKNRECKGRGVYLLTRHSRACLSLIAVDRRGEAMGVSMETGQEKYLKFE